MSINMLDTKASEDTIYGESFFSNSFYEIMKTARKDNSLSDNSSHTQNTSESEGMEIRYTPTKFMYSYNEDFVLTKRTECCEKDNEKKRTKIKSRKFRFV
mmetsp:Transcript_1987/g.2481  ORF Transcript_1987/g.2481 Transcript_1987/m.2481 type:complete len:100 (+) Transcript_1987:103-402(+)